MANISRELKTGIIAVLTIGIFIWGFNFIKGSNLFDSSRHFFVEYENVQGLSVSAPVTINGLTVGTVDKIYFHPNKVGVLVVNFSLENNFKFSKNSIAEIYSPDFISGKSIKILPSFDGDNAVSGDTLTGKIEAGILGALNDQIAPLQAKVTSFITNADTLLVGINAVFNQETQTNLKSAIASLNTTLSTFNTASKSLNIMLAENGKIDSVLTNASIASSNLVSLTDSLNESQIKETVLQLQSTITKFNGILSTIENGDGSIGKLLKDEGLYDNLEAASKEMEELLFELKVNPKRFVHFSLFGKKPKPYKPEEVVEE
ncbi:MCE family protein [Aureibaculum marinum]|uniref:MCE family protein n=1 Tax=Aureibaculum marinum TaxID=2487930 RepID=A0A3N4P4H9_9FLAO|nr:MlaD family protein [Aureibaculum marinum]RPD98649.1 MCE family protein [Aureibaculum marinum]